MERNLLAVLVALAMALIAGYVWFDHRYPCLKYGEERLMGWNQVGSTGVPIYGRPCLVRAGQSEAEP